MLTAVASLVARLLNAPVSPHWGYPRDFPRRPGG